MIPSLFVSDRTSVWCRVASVFQEVSEQYTQISIFSNTSHTNPLLQHSEIIHQTFLKILQKCGGFFGVVNIDDFHLPILGKPNTYLILEDHEDIESVDYIMSVAKQQFDWLE